VTYSSSNVSVHTYFSGTGLCCFTDPKNSFLWHGVPVWCWSSCPKVTEIW